MPPQLPVLFHETVSGEGCAVSPPSAFSATACLTSTNAAVSRPAADAYSVVIAAYIRAQQNYKLSQGQSTSQTKFKYQTGQDNRRKSCSKAKPRSAGYCLQLKPDHGFCSAGSLGFAFLWSNMCAIRSHLPLRLLFRTVKMSQIKLQLPTSAPFALTQRLIICCLWLRLLRLDTVRLKVMPLELCAGSSMKGQEGSRKWR